MLRNLPMALLVFVCLLRSAAAEPSNLITSAKRILFLGDSITHAGQYVTYLETQLRLRHPDHMPLMINLGLPSETCSGLSEPDHPFPRPDVHERLDRALAKFEPDLVVACYGMNDGIYHPFSEQRFKIYQSGVNRLIEKVHAANAKLILMTPPAFDALPLKKKGNLRPVGSDQFAWFAIYENYDDVLRRYAQWIMQQGERVEMVIDLHTPVSEYVAAKRREDADFTMSPDGVHVNAEGHQVLADTILAKWGYGKPLPVDAKLAKLASDRQKLLHDAWLSHVGHKRPGVKAGLPIDKAKQEALELERKMAEIVGVR